MLTRLRAGKRIVGLKQSRRAIEAGQGAIAFAASDADAALRSGFEDLCRKQGVPVYAAHSKRELGTACGIDVGAAFAVLLRE